MQVTELESKGLKKQFKVVVDAQTIAQQIETELKSAGAKIKIPGFRPGNIPMKVLQQRYGKSVEADVVNKLIQTATTDALREKKVRPALQPKINLEDYKEGSELSFTIDVESFPEVPEPKLDDITLDRKTFEIDEKAIDEALAKIAERSPQFNNAGKDAKAQSGDVVIIDFLGKIDDVAFDGGKAEGFRLELGSGQFIEGFEDQLIGAKQGEKREVKVKFPDEYPGKEVAGKQAVFDVTIHEILKGETPEVNEEFATSRGFANQDALREAVKKQLESEYGQIVRNLLKKQLFDLLEERNNFDLPQGMVDMELNTIWTRLKQAQEQGDTSLAGKSDDELKEEYGNISRRRVKLGILLAEIGNQQKLQITREELTRAMLQQAQQYPGQERMVMEFYQKNPDRVDDLRGPILEEKAVDYILSKVKFKDETVSLTDLDAMIEDEEGEADSSKKSAKGESKPKKKK
jgi:trigger factor